MSLSPVAVDLILEALLVAGVSSFLSSLNFFASIGNMRLPGLALGVLPLFPWAILITAVLLLLTLPVLSGAVGISGHPARRAGLTRRPLAPLGSRRGGVKACLEILGRFVVSG